MEQFKCAFKHTLIGRQFACEHAIEITSREGPNIACNSASMHTRCGILMAGMRRVAVPAFGVEDDLTKMPQSVLVKIQFGGLLGLQALLTDEGHAADAVANIARLVTRAESRYGDVAEVPCADLTPAITTYKLRRRRK